MTMVESEIVSDYFYCWWSSVVSPSVSWQLNWSLKASSSWGMASSTLTSLCSSALSEVTPFPSMPQGTMCSNHDRSVLQFRAKPWDVTYRPQWIPTNTTWKQLSDLQLQASVRHQCAYSYYYYHFSVLMYYYYIYSCFLCVFSINIIIFVLY